jgi:hypothetical protein
MADITVTFTTTDAHDGAAHTVDEVITALQNLGLVKQS